ncbi:hypothetical protein, partial [Endozoicomonas arenosclerae]|uniref:hypothetical protein n=1 Tax=Endozoicomonas arenosclerae TaxID=1633495 RepID=UPI000B206A25
IKDILTLDKKNEDEPERLDMEVSSRSAEHQFLLGLGFSVEVVKTSDGQTIYILRDREGSVIKLSHEEVVRWLSLLFEYQLAKALPQYFGLNLPAGGGDEPSSWQAEHRTVPWAILRKIDSLLREYAIKEAWEKLREQYKNKIRTVPVERKEKNEKREVEVPAIREDGQLGEAEAVRNDPLVVKAASGEPEGGNPYPGSETGSTSTPPDSPDESLLAGLLRKKLRPILGSWHRSIFEAMYPDIELRGKKTKQMAFSLRANKTLEDKKGFQPKDPLSLWTELRLSHSNFDLSSFHHLILISELLEQDLVVFLVRSGLDDEVYRYKRIDESTHKVWLQEAEEALYQDADIFLAYDGSQWIRLYQEGPDGELLIPEEMLASPTESIVRPQYTVRKYIPETDESIVNTFQKLIPDASKIEIEEEIKSRLKEGSEHSDSGVTSEVQKRLFHAGLIAYQASDRSSSETVLMFSKTLLEMIEGFWEVNRTRLTVTGSLIYAPELVGVIEEGIQLSKEKRLDLTLGAIPSSLFSPAFLSLAMPVLMDVIEVRFQLFHILGEVLSRPTFLGMNNAFVYGGMANRSHLIANLSGDNKALELQIPAVNDIDLMVSESDLIQPLMQSFIEMVRSRYPDLMIEGPDPVAVDSEGLETKKLKIRTANTRIFTLDVSTQVVSEPALFQGVSLNHLPIQGMSHEPAHDVAFPMINLWLLIDKLLSEASEYSESEGAIAQYRIEKARSSLQILTRSNQGIASTIRRKYGDDLATRLDLAEEAPVDSEQPDHVEASRIDNQDDVTHQEKHHEEVSDDSGFASRQDPESAGGSSVCISPSEPESDLKEEGSCVKQAHSPKKPRSRERRQRPKREVVKKEREEPEAAPLPVHSEAKEYKTVSPELMEQVRKDLEERVAREKEVTSGPSDDLRKPSQFGNYFENIEDEFWKLAWIKEGDFEDQKWFIQSILPEKQGKLWLWEALRHSSMGEIEGRFQLRGLFANQKAFRRLLVAHELYNPVAGFLINWIFLADQVGLYRDHYMRQSALSFKPARQELIKNMINPDHSHFDPQGLVKVWRIAHGRKQAEFSIDILESRQERTPRELAVEQALDLLADGSASEQAAAWLLSVLEVGDGFHPGVAGILMAAGMESYLPAEWFQTSQYEADTDVEQWLFSWAKGRQPEAVMDVYSVAAETLAKSQDKHLLKVLSEAKAIFSSLSRDWFQMLMYSGQMLDLRQWERLYEILMSSKPTDEQLAHLDFLKRQIQLLDPEKVPQYLQDRRGYKRSCELQEEKVVGEMKSEGYKNARTLFRQTVEFKDSFKLRDRILVARLVESLRVIFPAACCVSAALAAA